jgi:predicted HicB family RNase H-like nuclease
VKTIIYQNYCGEYEIDYEAGIFYGQVMVANAMLTFEAFTLNELYAAFAYTIADYHEWCCEEGVEPCASNLEYQNCKPFVISD